MPSARGVGPGASVSGRATGTPLRARAGRRPSKRSVASTLCQLSRKVRAANVRRTWEGGHYYPPDLRSVPLFLCQKKLKLSYFSNPPRQLFKILPELHVVQHEIVCFLWVIRCRDNDHLRNPVDKTPFNFDLQWITIQQP